MKIGTIGSTKFKDIKGMAKTLMRTQSIKENNVFQNLDAV